MSSSKTMEMPAPSVGTKSNGMSTKVTTGAPGSATSPEARMRTKSGAAAVASDMQQKNASDGTGNGSSNLLFTSKISNDKAKFKFPLATRMNEEPNFVLTSEALIEAAGEGADTLLSDGKMRRGKWTKEEEAYANNVIRDFQDGIINNAEIGITLRSLLADKLLCDPMRISKKFAGKACVGKQVYGVGNRSKFTGTEICERSEELEKSRSVFFGKVRSQQQKSRVRKLSASKTSKNPSSVTSSDYLKKNPSKSEATQSLELMEKFGAASNDLNNASFQLHYSGLARSNATLQGRGTNSNNLKHVKKKRRKGDTSNGTNKGLGSSGNSTRRAGSSAKNSNSKSLAPNRKKNPSKFPSANKKGKVSSKTKKGQKKQFLNPSESILCLQSYISEDNDLQVDTTMFHPEKEEAMLGIQF